MYDGNYLPEVPWNIHLSMLRRVGLLYQGDIFRLSSLQNTSFKLRYANRRM